MKKLSILVFVVAALFTLTTSSFAAEQPAQQSNTVIIPYGPGETG
ncbi:tripartite-type tricarboxylate transporter receptor subunit TctC [Brevibacillus aydinogluensis]|jgi:hypothetical protein|nr:hypothetical protein [Brevibacillus aydinogluensis]MDT3418256.1 tripartite-type tricarboxylate transporter receptor subunit TctC [Brevibacillus aydinogluensis]